MNETMIPPHVVCGIMNVKTRGLQELWLQNQCECNGTLKYGGMLTNGQYMSSLFKHISIQDILFDSRQTKNLFTIIRRRLRILYCVQKNGRMLFCI